jgi:hypothetical protein
LGEFGGARQYGAEQPGGRRSAWSPGMPPRR